MKVDKIIKNAKIFTSEKDKPMASALAVKDGKFVYVGDEAGLAGYEGEVTDLGGKFIMPGMAVKKLGRVTVSNASEAVKEIFETTGFDQMMSVE